MRLYDSDSGSGDVTLLDIDLGGESGLELARRLHRGPDLAPRR